jgi:glycosyltransferase involved in cell wall biosynthesis
MRILMLTQFYPPIVGGEERHVRNLAIALTQRGHSITVVTLGVPGTRDYETDEGVSVYRVHGTLQRLGGLFSETERRFAPPFPDPELVIAIRRIVIMVKPDIVHSHNWFFLGSFLPLRGWSGAPLIHTLHDYGPICAKKNLIYQGAICDGPGLLKCLRCTRDHYGVVKGAVTALGNYGSGFFSRRAVDNFIVVSQAAARYNRLADSGVPFEVIPTFVPDDISVLSSDTDYPYLSELPAEGYILFVGDVMRLKGVDVLLKAYASLDQVPPLVLIGRRTQDTPSVLPPNVHLLGPWPHPAIMHAWSRCLFGIAPSVGPETCGTVVMEAMASKKVIIVADIGGYPELVDSGETGLVVPPGDDVALAAAMQLLLSDPDLMVKMAETAFDRVDCFKATSVVSRIENVYQTVREREAA